jgi:hypothetical protein
MSRSLSLASLAAFLLRLPLRELVRRCDCRRRRCRRPQPSPLPGNGARPPPTSGLPEERNAAPLFKSPGGRRGAAGDRGPPIILGEMDVVFPPRARQQRRQREARRRCTARWRLRSCSSADAVAVAAAPAIRFFAPAPAGSRGPRGGAVEPRPPSSSSSSSSLSSSHRWRRRRRRHPPPSKERRRQLPLKTECRFTTHATKSYLPQRSGRRQLPPSSRKGRNGARKAFPNGVIPSWMGSGGRAWSGWTGGCGLQLPRPCCVARCAANRRGCIIIVSPF